MSVEETDPSEYVADAHSWRKMLEARPVKNQAIKKTFETDEKLVVDVQLKKASWLVPPLTWFFNPREVKRHEMDVLGKEIFELCNGKRRVEHIIDKFAERHELSFHESRVSVSMYIKSLVQRGIIIIIQ